MVKKSYKYTYGPVNSWRLGRSLGIDLISQPEKICSFDCIYCQLGDTEHKTVERKIYVKTEIVIKEFKNLDLGEMNLNYITFSGTGEPTLALNLGKVIKKIKTLNVKIPIAVLTNSSLINQNDVKEDLKLADFVMFKLDVSSEELLKKINRPSANIKFSKIVEGIKNFKKSYEGKLALQIMFIEENKFGAKKIGKVAREIDPDEVQINTPLRPCQVTPLSEEEIESIKKGFRDLNIIGVYDKKPVTRVSRGTREQTWDEGRGMRDERGETERESRLSS